MNMQMREGLTAGAVAGVLTGIPSTLVTRHPIDATRAAGTLLGAPTVPRGAVAHAALSLGWGVILARVLPRHPGPAVGAVAGIAIAALDLGLVGRRYPMIRQLPTGPQVADHVAYGVTLAWWLRRSRR